MCDYFFQRRMEKDEGELADIVRAGGRGGTLSSSDQLKISDWQLSSSETVIEGSNCALFTAANNFSNDFGDPFVNLRDPLLMSEFTGVELFNRSVETLTTPTITTPTTISTIANDRKVETEEQEMSKKTCSNIFSRVLQISPSAPSTSLPQISPRITGKPTPIITGEMMKISPLDHGGVQISSPRTTGIKRRKSQAKKVVCIPAPAAANNRPSSGEVVPSDLWAWRKYGQKPIKGSPYPRGYYRCSSSKGCSARKQVERSRTDPNMLVITYTSEHNHPWPTQRNALAGSTRSQPSKNTSSGSKNSSVSSKSSALKEESKDKMSSVIAHSAVKEEATDHIDNDIVQSEDNEFDEFDQVFHESYKPMIPETNQSDDFFADLAELEPDPMTLIFAKGFAESKQSEEKASQHKSMDSFNMFDSWSSGGGSSFGDQGAL